jgi:hypothetical protein
MDEVVPTSCDCAARLQWGLCSQVEAGVGDQYRVVARDRAPAAWYAVGVRALRGTTVVDDVFSLVVVFAPDYLEPQKVIPITWRLQVSPSATPGIYRLQPFTTATVWFFDWFGAWPKLESRIDPGASDTDFGSSVEIR